MKSRRYRNYGRLFRYLKECDAFAEWEIERMKWMKTHSNVRPLLLPVSIQMNIQNLLGCASFVWSATDEGVDYWSSLARKSTNFEKTYYEGL